MLYVLGERLIELSRFGVDVAIGNINRNTGFRKARESTSCDQRIGIRHRTDHACDAGLNDRIGAWACAAGMAAGFEVDVQRAALSAFSGGFNGKDLAVLLARISMEAIPRDLAVLVQYDRPDARIRRCQRDTLAREFKSASQVKFVLSVDRDMVS
jgi:hypothetical protein